MRVVLDNVRMPEKHTGYVPVDLTKETMEWHREKVLSRMAELGLDVLLLYGDREHGSNYAYLTGFETRFDKAVKNNEKGFKSFINKTSGPDATCANFSLHE